MTLTAVGARSEKTELRKLTGSGIDGDRIRVRLAKEMPFEVTHVDTAALLVVERDGQGRTVRQRIAPSVLMLNGERIDRDVLSARDGKRLAIRSSWVADADAVWGVRRGDQLELEFNLPAAGAGVSYFLETHGFHTTQFAPPSGR